MSRVEVNIMGQSYVLASPDGESELLVQAAQKVDEAMCSIRDAGKIKARDRIAVLASLNMAFDMLKQPSPLPTIDPQPSSPSANHAGHQDRPWSDHDLAQLRVVLHKLDHALGNDGQLL